MRLLLVCLLFFTSCAVSSQKYIARETILYPNIYTEVAIPTSKEVTIYVYKKTLTFKAKDVVFFVEIGKFLDRRPAKGGGYFSTFQGYIGEDPVGVSYLYSNKSELLSIGLKQGTSLIVFILNYETKLVNEVHR